MEQEAAEESDNPKPKMQKTKRVGHGLPKQARAGDAFLRPFFWKRE